MMIQNFVKRTLQSKGIAIGSWLNFAHTSNAEILASCGFEFVGIDMEHSVIDMYEMQNVIMAIEANGCCPIVRMTGNDPNQAKQVMDAGAWGVIIPMVTTAEQAELAVRSVKYPPQGIRSVGIGRAHKYGYAFKEYFSTANDESLVIVQIEHIDALKNIDKIFSVKGVDAYMIGPYDLSGSMGIAGQVRHPEMLRVQREILAAAKRHNIAPGIFIIYPEFEAMKEYMQEGYQFFVIGSDLVFLTEYAKKNAQDALAVKKACSV
jgi:2-keto-3-deoxy-L-rhamnonate aldolase RhmA